MHPETLFEDRTYYCFDLTEFCLMNENRTHQNKLIQNTTNNCNFIQFRQMHQNTELFLPQSPRTLAVCQNNITDHYIMELSAFLINDKLANSLDRIRVKHSSNELNDGLALI